MTAVSANGAYFIKLGRAGDWESECLADGTLRFGYREVPHDLCARGDWAAVKSVMAESRGDPGAATRDVQQIRAFYESTEQSIFITFAGGRLHWCRPRGKVELLPDQSRRRPTLDGWHDTSLGGTPLTVDRLSGNLLKVQMFRGTICEVRALDYLTRKIGDELLPEVAAAEEAERKHLSAITGLLRLLTWGDFELLVDLVFSNSGWRRISEVGGTQRTVDLELMLPSTGERAFVQVKSEASLNSLADYTAKLATRQNGERMFFVWHTGSIPEEQKLEDVILLGPERLSRMVLDAGLATWLREKVS